MKKRALFLIIMLMGFCSCLRVATHAPVYREENITEKIKETGQVSETLCATSDCLEDRVELSLSMEKSYERKRIQSYDRMAYIEKEIAFSDNIWVWAYSMTGIPLVVTIFQYPFVAIMAIDEEENTGRLERSFPHNPRIESVPIMQGSIRLLSPALETVLNQNPSGGFTIPLHFLEPEQGNFSFVYQAPSGKSYSAHFAVNWASFHSGSLIAAGDEAFKQQKFHQAAGFYRLGGDMEKMVQSLVFAGEAALKEKNYSSAIEYFEKVGQADKAKAVYVLWGEDLLKNKSFYAAIEQFKKAGADHLRKKTYEAWLSEKGIQKVSGGKIGAWGSLAWGMDMSYAEEVLRSEGFQDPPADTQLDFASQFQSIIEKQQKQLNPKKEKLPEKKLVLKKQNLEITCYFFELEPGYWPLYQISLIYDESRITGLKILEGKANQKYLNLEWLEKLKSKHGNPALLDTETHYDFSQDETHTFEIKSYQWDDGISSIEINVSRMVKGKNHLSGKFDPGIYYTSNALWDYYKKLQEEQAEIEEESEEEEETDSGEYQPYKEKWERDFDESMDRIKRKLDRDMDRIQRDLERDLDRILRD